MPNPIQSFFRQSWLVLILASGLSAALAGVDYGLRDRIAENTRQRLEKAVLEVVPGGTVSEPVEVSGVQMYRVKDDSGACCGWATQAEGRGFQDRIRMMVGISNDGGRVTGLTVLESNETPGLGDRIQQPEFRNQFVGKSTEHPFTRSRPGVSAAAPVDAITGATISSDAVIDAINSQINMVGKELTSHPNAPAEARP
ncbi:MAG: FMN-binding protein [Planctomycetaceae bacterium]